jgi:sulfonate transport system ATP-binding protein
LFLADRVVLMGVHPAGIRQTQTVEVPRPRDRRDPRLAMLKAEALSALYQAHEIA